MARRCLRFGEGAGEGTEMREMLLCAAVKDSQEGTGIGNRFFCDDLGFVTMEELKSGKKAALSLAIDTKGIEPGTYTRDVIVICNDYQNPIKKVRITFTVE